MEEAKVNGQIAKISTTADQCVRLIVDIPNELAPADIIKWLNSTVSIQIVERAGNGSSL